MNLYIFSWPKVLLLWEQKEDSGRLIVVFAQREMKGVDINVLI
jgi:hypothetical protein